MQFEITWTKVALATLAIITFVLANTLLRGTPGEATLNILGGGLAGLILPEVGKKKKKANPRISDEEDIDVDG